MLVILQTLKSGKRRQHHVKDEDSMADSKLQCWFVSLALQKAKQPWATYKEFAMGKKKQHSRKEGQILRRKYCSVAVDNKANTYICKPHQTKGCSKNTETKTTDQSGNMLCLNVLCIFAFSNEICPSCIPLCWESVLGEWMPSRALED